jgi:hypothetical protein
MSISIFDVLRKGVDKENPIFIKEFPIKSLSLSKKSIKDTYYMDIRRGKPSFTNGPIKVMYNIENGQFIVEDGYHRLVENIIKVKRFIDTMVWSAQYSDYISNIQKSDLWFIPKRLDDNIPYIVDGGLK